MKVSAMLNRKRFGAVIRVYADKPELVEGRVAMVQKTVEQLRGLTIGGKIVFSEIEVVVWNNPIYQGSDCGQTAPRLREIFPVGNSAKVEVHEYRTGGIFCGILNYAIIK